MKIEIEKTIKSLNHKFKITHDFSNYPHRIWYEDMSTISKYGDEFVHSGMTEIECLSSIFIINNNERSMNAYS